MKNQKSPFGACRALCDGDNDDDDANPAQINAIYYGCHHLARKRTRYNYVLLNSKWHNRKSCTLPLCVYMCVRVGVARAPIHFLLIRHRFFSYYFLLHFHRHECAATLPSFAISGREKERRAKCVRVFVCARNGFSICHSRLAARRKTESAGNPGRKLRKTRKSCKKFVYFE